MFNVFGAPQKQVLETGEMLNMFNVWGKSSQKRETLNTFNISPVLAFLAKKHLTYPLFRGHGFTKQGRY